MQLLSPDNLGVVRISLNQTFPGHVMNFGPHIVHPKCVVHCNLTQVHTPRVSFRSHSNHSRHTGVLSCVVLINSVMIWAARVNGAASLVAAPANRRCAVLCAFRTHSPAVVTVRGILAK